MFSSLKKQQSIPVQKWAASAALAALLFTGAGLAARFNASADGDDRMDRIGQVRGQVMQVSHLCTQAGQCKPWQGKLHVGGRGEPGEPLDFTIAPAAVTAMESALHEGKTVFVHYDEHKGLKTVTGVTDKQTALYTFEGLKYRAI